MPSRASAEELRPGDTLGPYRLEAILGQGQMGVVYRAVRKDQAEVFALKVLRRELSEDDSFRRRFEREGEIAGSLTHKRLVPVVDRGEIEGHHFLAARYVPGRSLAERIAQEGRLDAAEIGRVVSDVGSGLDELHRLELVHRDVKPSNVILDDQGRALLTDFGLARGEAHSRLTRQGRIAGTVDYLAPEVIRGEPASAASDLYSLGCVAYECAVGRPPFGSRTLAEACIAHLREAPPDPVDAREDLPSGFATMLLTGLAKDPGQRPASGRAYGRLLRAAAA